MLSSYCFTSTYQILMGKKVGSTRAIWRDRVALKFIANIAVKTCYLQIAEIKVPFKSMQLSRNATKLLGFGGELVGIKVTPHEVVNACILYG